MVGGDGAKTDPMKKPKQVEVRLRSNGPLYLQ
jgi:hypothetical protein